MVLLALLASPGCVQRDPAQSRLEQAEAALAAGETRRARALFEEAAASRPEDPRAWWGLARARREAGEPAAALQAADRAAAFRSPDAAQRAWLCALWLEAGQHALRSPERAAPDRHVRALELASRRERAGCRPGPTAGLRLEAHLGQARLALSRGDEATALVAYRAACGLPGAPGEAYARAAELLVGKGLYAQARSVLVLGLERHPGERSLQVWMVRVLTKGLAPSDRPGRCCDSLRENP